MIQWKDESDDVLAEAVRSSSSEGFKALYYRYYEQLYCFVCHRIRSTDIARDFVQEVFTRLWKNRANVDPQQSIKAYLYRIANNLVIDHVRKKQSEHAYRTDLDMNPHESSIEMNMTIMSAIGKLPQKMRSVFTLSRFDGLTYQEIAEICDVSVKTVESRMSQALQRLRKELTT